MLGSSSSLSSSARMAARICSTANSSSSLITRIPTSRRSLAAAAASRCCMSTKASTFDPTATIIIDDTAATQSTTNPQQEEQHPLYPKLFAPYRLNMNGLDEDDDRRLLPNRVLMGSMHTGLEGHSMPNMFEKFLNFVDKEDNDKPHSHTLDRMATYFRRRALGGVGLMVTGGIAPNYEGWVGPFSAQLTSAKEMELHEVVTQAVHDVPVPIYGSSNNKEVSSKIVMQILHTGRYAYHPFARSAESGKSPISPFKAKALSTADIQRTISDFVRSASFAKQAGYDGVEIMGSEGYLLSQFLSPRTNSNQRTDQYGGISFENRSRFPLELVREVRQALGNDFIIIFRISLWELVDGGMSFDEAVRLAKELKHAGVTILNTGIGWHESRIPTIASNVPRGAFVSPTKQLKQELMKEFSQNSKDDEIPAIVSTNRINAPDTAEHILQDGTSDLISMARPLLADPDFIQKAMNQKSDSINTCIACNQACLDHAFVGKTASCLVNPAACHESELDLKTMKMDLLSEKEEEESTVNDDKNESNERYALPVKDRKNIGVIGAGPAGIAFACTAAELGHKVTLYDRSSKVGGQFHMAKRVPGKEEFYEAIRYWESRLHQNDLAGTVNIELNTEMSVDQMSELTSSNKIDKFIVSTGVTPRDPNIPGSEKFLGDRVLNYIDVLRHNKPVGKRVAVIGAGGIGFDVSEFLIYGDTNNCNNYDTSTTKTNSTKDADDDAGISRKISPAAKVSVEEFWKEWGVDPKQEHRGGLVNHNNNNTDNETSSEKEGGHQSDHNNNNDDNNDRLIYLMQRKKGKVGGGLGRTTGWIHRASLKHSNRVTNVSGVKSYDKIDDDGNLVYTDKDDEQRVLEVDTVVLCAGQIEERTLELDSQSRDELKNIVYPIGGAYKAGELDAKRAIDMGTRLAHKIHLDDEVVPGKHVFTSSVGTEEKLFRFLKKWM